MVNIGIVILNYLSYDVTIKCVDHFKKQEKNNVNVKIIVVDNCSPNESYKNLFNEYKNDDLVRVVKTPVNLGFAKGNNYGYKKLLTIIDPDFVIMSNSDAYVKDQGLYEWIEQSYQKYHFGILGPSIYSVKRDFYQSPTENMSENLKILRKIQFNLNKDRMKVWLKYKLNRPYKNIGYDTWNNSLSSKIQTDKTLHGAFEIFSRRYFKKFNLPYDNETFMYMEENILKLRCDYADLPMVYSPEYKIYHLQAVSTKKATSNDYQRILFKQKNMAKSLRRYIQLVKQFKKKRGI